MNTINLELFPLEKIAQELYDFKKIGALSIPHFLTSEFCEGTVAEIKEREKYFRAAPRVEGTTLQELHTYYYGDADGLRDSGQFPLVSHLKDEYSVLYKRLGERARFQQGSVINSRGIHHYPIGSVGMGVHRDYSTDINLISIFVLGGTAPFYVCADKQGRGKVALHSAPGSLILMRAPRNELENDYRPYHCVGAVEEERFTLLFRQKKQTYGFTSLKIQ